MINRTATRSRQTCRSKQPKHHSRRYLRHSTRQRISRIFTGEAPTRSRTRSSGVRLRVSTGTRVRRHANCYSSCPSSRQPRRVDPPTEAYKEILASLFSLSSMPALPSPSVSGEDAQTKSTLTRLHSHTEFQSCTKFAEDPNQVVKRSWITEAASTTSAGRGSRREALSRSL